MNDIEKKRQRIENAAKIGGVLAVALILGPFYLVILNGLGVLFALVGTAIVGITAVNFLPWFSCKLANWKLKSLKSEFAKNPIETLENLYKGRKESLILQRDNIKQRIAVASKIFDQITSFESQFGKPSPRRDQYAKLNQLVEHSKDKYQKAQVSLVAFGNCIEEKRADWEIAQSMAEANKLANVGEDFLSKLATDTALTSIQDGLNLAFAELDASVMDENIQKVLSGQVVEVTVSPVKSTKHPAKKLSAPSDLDFEFESPARQKVAVS
jgi:hypothetical protein